MRMEASKMGLVPFYRPQRDPFGMQEHKENMAIYEPKSKSQWEIMVGNGDRGHRA